MTQVANPAALPAEKANAWSRSPAALGWDGALAAISLFLGTGALLDVVLGWPGGNLVVQATWSILYAVVGLLMAYRHGWQWIFWTCQRMPEMCLVLSIALVSFFWSLFPDITLRRTISLCGTIIIGIFVGYNFSPRAMMRILFWSFIALLVTSVVLATLVPDYGTSIRIGAAPWKGVTTNRNALGNFAAISAMLFLIGTIGKRINILPGFALIFLAVFTLFMTGSATSLIMLAVGTAAFGCFLAAKRLRFPSLAALLMLLLALGYAAYLSVLALEHFTAALGRDPTLTNRTTVWAAALEIIRDRPWIGYGYQAVWGYSSQIGLPQTAGLGSWATHAHNGYLQVATELGLPATVIAVAFVLRIVLQCAQGFIQRPSPFSLFAVSYVFMFIISNLAEARLFTPQDTTWMLFVAASVAVIRSIEPRSRRSRRKRRSRRRHEKPTATNQTLAPDSGD